MKERITIYGTLKSFEQISPEAYLLVIKEWQSGKEWEVVASRWNVYENLVENGHCYASGVKALGGIIADEVDRWGRYCDVCGKWHTEGYYVGEYNYACSEECAVALYGGDWNAFKADLALLDDPETCDYAPTYWTEW